MRAAAPRLAAAPPAGAAVGSTIFACEVRLLACDHCGAPLVTASVGQRVACRYCGAQHVIGARDDSPLHGVAQLRLSREDRMALLAQQVDAERPRPAFLSGLMQGGRLAPWKLDESVTLWQSARREARTGNMEAEERLSWLTILVAEHLGHGSTPDLRRQRAIYESALDAMSLPRHRQVMRCKLSICALRAGDLHAAEAWLAPCDRESTDIETDTALRIARAFLDTVRGRPDLVLETLERAGPVQREAQLLAEALRIDAWEMCGHEESARLLLDAVLRSSPSSEYDPTPRFRELLARYAWLGLGRETVAARLARDARRRRAAWSTAVALLGGLPPLAFVVNAWVFANRYELAGSTHAMAATDVFGTSVILSLCVFGGSWLMALVGALTLRQGAPEPHHG